MLGSVTAERPKNLTHSMSSLYFLFYPRGCALPCDRLEPGRLAERRLEMAPSFKKVQIIYNPNSGQGFKWPWFRRLVLGLPGRSGPAPIHPDAYLDNLHAELMALGIEAEGSKTSSAEEATALAAACSQADYDLVIAAGGDGTINAVINGLAQRRTALAIVPSGTINLLSLQLNLPATIREACERIRHGQLQKIDLGLLNQRYFASLAGIGFDAFVVKNTDTRLKRRLGMMAYALSFIGSSLVYPFRSIDIKMDDDPNVHSGYMFIVGNVKYYGGRMILQPTAAVTDGMLDLCIIKKRDFLSFINYMWRLRHGDIARYMDVDYFKCRQIHVLNKKEYIQVDGDYVGRLASIHIQVVPQALNIVV